eukprot:scaffold97891_cov36-Phaeocystis_antarctica.AAC.1
MDRAILPAWGRTVGRPFVTSRAWPAAWVVSQRRRVHQSAKGGVLSTALICRREEPSCPGVGCRRWSSRRGGGAAGAVLGRQARWWGGRRGELTVSSIERKVGAILEAAPHAPPGLAQRA